MSLRSYNIGSLGAGGSGVIGVTLTQNYVLWGNGNTVPGFSGDFQFNDGTNTVSIGAGGPGSDGTVEIGNATGGSGTIAFGGGGGAITGGTLIIGTTGGIGFTTPMVATGTTFVGGTWIPTRLLSSGVTLADAATITINLALGNDFFCTMAGNRSFVLSNAPPVPCFQKFVIHLTASGADRTPTLATGASGTFGYGADITGITTVLSGKTNEIGCEWNPNAFLAYVQAESKGF